MSRTSTLQLGELQALVFMGTADGCLKDDCEGQLLRPIEEGRNAAQCGRPHSDQTQSRAHIVLVRRPSFRGSSVEFYDG